MGKEDKYELCNSWINMIIWNFDYYFNGCKDYLYYFPYNCSPTLKDIVHFFKNDKITNEIIDNKPIQPEQQLTIILPYTSQCFLKPNTRKLVNEYLDDYYPTKFKILKWGKTYFHESIPVLPKLDIARYIPIWEKISVTIDKKSYIKL